MKRISIFLGLLLAIPAAAQTPDPEAAYRTAASAIDADLAAELQKLAEVRARIAKEKPALSTETAKIASDLRVKRETAELARQERDAVLHDLQSLSIEVRKWRDEANYIDGLLSEFRKEFEVALHPSEAATLEKLFKGFDADSIHAASEARTQVAASAANWLAQAGTARVVEGEALDVAGTLHAGQFVVAGPVGWFRSADGKVAGLTDAGDGLRPRVLPGIARADAIAQVAKGGSADLAFDSTLGSAVALDEAGESVTEHFLAGGLWMYPILALALAATLGGLVKMFQLLRIRDLSARSVGAILASLKQGKRDEALQAAERIQHPARALLTRGIELSGEKRTRDEIEEALYEQYLEAQPPLQRGLPVIAIASAAAPLLGLLGTVTGMIHTFKLITIFGTGDAKSLASGISEALITTEFGLVVAIPALILHAFLSRRVQGIRAAMEMTSIAFLNGVETGDGAEA